ncbi:BMP family ABC transporter substrate-binding protein [Desulfovibrio psychrotolerans]|uniref:BMP family ABC transporter substrate-binding protein n=1 Tax=Desulfovibrio psychrotolerans TaxID=415242 RepID=A0A7J0BRE5_9BACT|nr:BMP family ABC transporter substrate-binding protein [Desulfovibrio psychrotolerans]GFM35762.1 BMP family ABC transporter substrate-binding protein [Desulfovibrio psychrotolerans]
MRIRFAALLMVLLLGVFGLAGCGSEEKKPAAEAPKAEETAKPAEQAAASAEVKPMQVGFVYVSPIGDAGYSYAHDMGRQAVAAMEGVTTSYVESVPEGADSERVIMNMARKNFDIIFTTSYGYMDPTLKVAGEFPNLTFLHCSGYKTAENMSAYFGRIYQARYLTGMVAGKMTKSNILGYAAAFPIPEVIRGINAFTLGARAVNPDVKVHVVWTKTWYDPATEKEAAKSLLDIGADVIAQHQDSPAPQEAAQERGAYSVGYNTDMTAFAPKSHLTAAVWNWAPFYTTVVDKVRKGEWKSDHYWWGLAEGIVDIAPYGEMVPEEVRALVDARKAEIKSGAYKVFTGPINDQSGKERIAAGEVAPDDVLLGMTWFVEGVVGSNE